MFFKKREIIDTRPTHATWPKRVFALSDLPSCYLTFLNPFLKKGLTVEQMIFIPRLQRVLTVIPEGILFWLEDQVVFLTRAGDHIRTEIIHRNDVLLVREFIELLNCQLSIAYRQDGEIRFKVFNYNRMAEDLIYPVYNTLLGNEPDYAPNVFLNPNTACERLFTESYMMFNFGKLCYRLCDHVKDFYWQRLPKQGFSRFMKSKADPENLIVRMDKGISIVNSNFYGFEAVYLLQKSIESISLEQKTESTVLTIKTKANKNYSFPIAASKLEEAKEFYIRNI